MRTSADFDPQDPTETETFGIDFVNEIPSGDSIASNPAPVMTLELMSGTDSDPSSRLIGPTTYDGTLVSTWIAGCQPGCTYKLTATINTALSRILTLYAFIPPDPGWSS